MNDRDRRLSADDVEALLPWYAAGTLGVQETAQVEAALAADAGLGRRLDQIREEMTEAIVLNEALGVPSARVAEKLFSAIDHERRTARDPAASRRVTGWLADLLSPRAYAFAAGAAVLLIVLEAGVIARLALEERAQSSGVFTTQSVRETPSRGLEAAFARVKFSPQASMADVTRFLGAQHAVIVEGPLRDGLYKVRIGDNEAPKDERDRLIRKFQSASDLVASATPTTE